MNTKKINLNKIKNKSIAGLEMTKEAITKVPVDQMKKTVKNTTEITTAKFKQMSTETLTNAKNKTQQIVNTMDINNDGRFDIEDIIILGMRSPGVRIDRKSFLKKEFKNYVESEILNLAIETTPMNAGISNEIINKISNNVIEYERNCVTGISAVLSTGGGLTMIATLPADIVQYYGYMLRTAQKLMYLYGYQQLDDLSEDDTLDSGTLNTLIICLGTMYGVVGANNALKVMAVALAKGVNKKFMETAVTKGVLYPIVKNILKWFGIKLTKKMCTNFFSKAIPLAGGIVGGAITYTTFKPCCLKLKETLSDTILSNKEYLVSENEAKLVSQITK